MRIYAQIIYINQIYQRDNRAQSLKGHETVDTPSSSTYLFDICILPTVLARKGIRRYLIKKEVRSEQSFLLWTIFVLGRLWIEAVSSKTGIFRDEDYTVQWHKAFGRKYHYHSWNKPTLRTVPVTKGLMTLYPERRLWNPRNKGLCGWNINQIYLKYLGCENVR